MKENQSKRGTKNGRKRSGVPRTFAKAGSANPRALPNFLNLTGWLLVMYGPWRITCSADNWLGRWCLPRAGNYAYPAASRSGRARAW